MERRSATKLDSLLVLISGLSKNIRFPDLQENVGGVKLRATVKQLPRPAFNYSNLGLFYDQQENETDINCATLKHKSRLRQEINQDLINHGRNY